jgi:multiple sugar transport system permease protein
MTRAAASPARALAHGFLVAYSVLTLLPFAWAVLTSLKTQREIAEAREIWPAAPTLEAYRRIVESDFTSWLGNSLFVALATTLLAAALNTMAGYALARLRFAGREPMFKALLLLAMVPPQVTLIPAYLVVARLGLVDTPWSLILTSAVNIGSIFMMRQFFVGFPVELEEAARLDGCSTPALFLRVVLPLAWPALATQSLFIFMGVWNEFMKPLLYISSLDHYMLTQGLNSLARQFEKSSAWNVIMAGSLVSIAPILLLYIVLNRFFLQRNDPVAGLK